MDLQPNLFTLHQLLNGRLFRIPQYQRAYSWGARQRQDLFEDIERARLKPNSSHFMATVVGLRRESRQIGTDEFQVVDVVDGQQRLTTLVILLKSIGLAASASNESQICAELSGLLVKADDVSVVLLQTNHDSGGHFQQYLRSGDHPARSTAKTAADLRLLSAIEECEVFVQQWTARGLKLSGLLALLKNRIKMVLYEIADESLVYTVFEVLNSRGLDVSHFDRLKSALMGIAFEAAAGNSSENIKELHDIWRKIYAAIGVQLSLSSEVLKFAATLRLASQPNRPLGEEDSVSILRKAAGDTAKGAIDISNWLLLVAEQVVSLRANPRLHGVTDIAQARLLAVSILLRSDLGKESQSDLLREWEKVSFRIFGFFRRDARTGVGDYVRSAWLCTNQKSDYNTLKEQICRIGSEYDVETGVEALRGSNCYEGWQTQLRYLLFRYEEHLAKQSNQKFDNAQWARIWEASASDSIEHILAQSLGSEDRNTKGLYVHRLGNLTLLPPRLNSKLGDKRTEEKLEAYRDTGLAVAVDVAHRIAAARAAKPNAKWNRDMAIEREEEICCWAAEEWA